MDKRSRLNWMLTILMGIILIDVTGYMIIERVNFADALYMTVITISTVGYKEVFPLSKSGELFTIFVIISGLGTFLYSVRMIAEYSVEGRLRKILGRRRMKSISKLKNHIVIAGFGRMGETVARAFHEKKKNFIIIEKDKERFSMADELGYNIILMDATVEESLVLAGIKKAGVFISLLSADADNVFTIMSARDLNPDLHIIARNLDKDNEKKLYRAGTNIVISPIMLASNRIINTTLKPNVVNLIDLVTQTGELPLSVEEITISGTSILKDKLIKESGLREKTEAMVVGIKRGEKMHFNPSANMKIQEDDILILIGEKQKLADIH